jgi:hypothetical protein
MALESELQLFLRRTSDGYHLEAEDGSLVIQSRTYRELREDLDEVMKSMSRPPRKVKVLIGSRRRPPAPVRTPSGGYPPVTASLLNLIA